MKSIDLQEIGYTLKAHGRDGQIRIFAEDKFLKDLENARALFIDLDGSHVPFLIESMEFKAHLLIKLEDIDSPEEASKFSQKTVFLHRDELNHYVEEKPAFELAALRGFKVYDQNNVYVGNVENIIEQQFQDLLEIKNEENSFFWPLHEDIILELDPEKQFLKLEFVDGFNAL